MTGRTAASSSRVAFSSVDGRRSTSAAGRTVVADSLRNVDLESAERAANAKTWRHEYVEHFQRSTTLSATRHQNALQIARDGLTSLRSHMCLSTADGDEPLSLPPGRPSSTQTTGLGGQGRPTPVLEVPYAGRTLSGASLREQLDRWADDGVVEPAFAQALTAVADQPEALALPGRTAVLLGAAAAMGPLVHLSRWGARVLAVDVPVTAVQQRIATLAGNGSGRTLVPTRAGRDIPGLSLSQELSEIFGWITAHLEDTSPVLGAHFYADGGAHVELTAAADLLAEELCRHDARTALAYLATPTDSFLVSSDAVAQSRQRWRNPRWNTLPRRFLHTGSGGRLFAPVYEQLYRDEQGTSWGVIDTLVTAQGPNYALAKRAQRWRAMAAAADGTTVSANVAPSAWTNSVIKNKTLAAVFRAAHRYGVEIFHPETAAALMAAKLAADVAGLTPRPPRHPEALFSHDAAHGGLWRQPFEPRSALGLAAARGMTLERRQAPGLG